MPVTSAESLCKLVYFVQGRCEIEIQEEAADKPDLRQMDSQMFNRWVYLSKQQRSAEWQLLASEHSRRLEDQIASSTVSDDSDPQDWETCKIISEALISSKNQYALRGYFKSVRHYLKSIKLGDFHVKMELVNLLINADKWSISQHAQMPYQFLTSSIIKIIYFHVMLENLSLFFFKCVDPIFVLEFYAQKVASGSKEISQFGGMDRDFWIRTEDLLMRSK